MEFFEQYSSDTDTFHDSGSEQYQAGPSGVHQTPEVPEVDERSVRQVYLLTYSQADVSAFPTRRSFAEAVVASFSGTPARIVQWVCCREKHKNGGLHYHMAIKLDRCQRWMPAKTFLTGHHGISVHFSDVHFNYYSAWKYVTKTDEHVLHSNDHPDLWNEKPPKTSLASREKKLTRKRDPEDDPAEQGNTGSEDELPTAKSTADLKPKPKKNKNVSHHFNCRRLLLRRE